jgi:hypothetical protein
MTPEQFQQLVDLLRGLGTQAFTIARQRALADALVGLAFNSLALLLGLYGLRATRRWLRSPEPNGELEMVAKVVASVGSVVVAVFGAISLAYNVIDLTSLDYAALEQLAKLVKP